MAGDWIKMRVDLYRDPKVCVIADELMDMEGSLAWYVSQMNQRDMTITRNVTRNATVGALVTVWGVMRQRGKRRDDDLFCRGVAISVIDDVADLPGFGKAMESVGWVVDGDEGLVFPAFFSEYNVDPNEKKASKAAERQRRYRERKSKSSDATRDVTRDVTVTHRIEKRREEKDQDQKRPPAAADFKADLFARWKSLSDGGGGAFLNKLFRDHKPEQRVMEAVERTLDDTRADPKAFVLGVLNTEARAESAHDALMARVQ